MTEVRVEGIAELIKATPGLEDTMANRPGLESPCLHCFFFFEHEDPTKPDDVQVQGWCLDRFQELLYDLDKEYSCTASRMAVSQLIVEINCLKDPPMAESRFGFMVTEPDLAGAFMEVAEKDDIEPLKRWLDRIPSAGDQENGGSGS